MKKCTWCGKEYSDDARACAVDQQPLEQVDVLTSSQSLAAAAPPTQTNDEAMLQAAANRNMLVGGLWCLVGILVTAFTYSAAAAGGTYVVAWGAIVFGALQFMKGLFGRTR